MKSIVTKIKEIFKIKKTEDEDLENTKAIIVSIDAILSDKYSKNTPNIDELLEDDINTKIRDLVLLYKDAGFKVILINSRKYKKDEENLNVYIRTHFWSLIAGIHIGSRFIREDGDNRKDSTIKKEIFNKHIKDYYDIEVVLDSGDSSVKCWRKLGLNTLQVS